MFRLGTSRPTGCFVPHICLYSMICNSFYFHHSLYENEYFTNNICVAKDSQNNLENTLLFMSHRQYIYIHIKCKAIKVTETLYILTVYNI